MFNNIFKDNAELIKLVREVNKESGLTEAVEVITHDWEMLNGKEASGKGHWEFALSRDAKALDHFEYEGEFEAAVQKAIAKAKQVGADEVLLV